MNTRLVVRTATIAMGALMLAVVSTASVAARDMPPQPWAGNRIWEASTNWAEYGDEPVAESAELEMLRQAWAGPEIQAASTNWADYGGVTLAETVKQQWARKQIQQASMNWADYEDEPVDASKP